MTPYQMLNTPKRWVSTANMLGRGVYRINQAKDFITKLNPDVFNRDSIGKAAVLQSMLQNPDIRSKMKEQNITEDDLKQSLEN